MNNMQWNTWKILGYLILMIGIWSCEAEEGCLDADATNFSPAADKDCCCTYPGLSVRIFYVSGEESFSVDSTYFDGAGNAFRIVESPMILSNFQLDATDGSNLAVEDTVIVEDVNGNALTLVDDFAVLEQNTFLYELGTFREFGSYEQLAFLLGLDAEANQTVPSSFPDEHPLATAEESLYLGNSEGYIFSQLSIVYNNGDTLTVSISGNDQVVPVTLDLPVTVERGFDEELQLDLDLPSLLADTDLILDNLNTIQGKIVSNSVNAFTIHN